MLAEWQWIVPDFARVYGVDLYSGVWESRPWQWFARLVLGLLQDDSLLHRALTRAESDSGGGGA